MLHNNLMAITHTSHISITLMIDSAAIKELTLAFHCYWILINDVCAITFNAVATIRWLVVWFAYTYSVCITLPCVVHTWHGSAFTFTITGFKHGINRETDYVLDWWSEE